MAKRGKGLGRGLNALIKDSAPAATTGAEPGDGGGPMLVAPSRIKANHRQPRDAFDEDALADLAASIRQHGILQPLTVRAADTGFELIAGERRLRAAKLADLKEVPIHVVEADDQQTLELALIENLQREDLNPIEEAEGYQRLADEFNLTQERISKRVGKSRASVANALRLLGLPPVVRRYLAEGRISAGHAKALLGLDDDTAREDLADKVVAKALSVRQTEQQVQRLKNPPAPPNGADPATEPDLPAIYLQDVADRLNQHFGTKVLLASPRGGADGQRVQGRITIEYYNNDDLDRILGIVGLDIN